MDGRGCWAAQWDGHIIERDVRGDCGMEGSQDGCRMKWKEGAIFCLGGSDVEAFCFRPGGGKRGTGQTVR